MLGPSYMGNFVKVMDEFLSRKSEYAKSAQEILGTSEIFPVLSCQAHDILSIQTSDMEKDIKSKTEKMQELNQQKNIIWVTSPSLFPRMKFAFSRGANAYCAQCGDKVLFPITHVTSQIADHIDELEIVFNANIFRKYFVVNVRCVFCYLETPSSKQ